MRRSQLTRTSTVIQPQSSCWLQELDDASAEAIAAAALAVNGGDPAAALVDLLRMYLRLRGAEVCR